MSRNYKPEETAYYTSPHPRDYPCSGCGAKPGEYCRSKNGKKIIKYEKIHAGRRRVFLQEMQRDEESQKALLVRGQEDPLVPRPVKRI